MVANAVHGSGGAPGGRVLGKGLRAVPLGAGAGWVLMATAVEVATSAWLSPLA